MREYPVFNVGDLVTYKKKKCVVLDIFQSEQRIKRHTIYSPEVGVYTAFSDELKPAGHSEEADKLIESLGA